MNTEALGIVLDLSLRQKNSIRLLDLVKKELVASLREFDNGDNVFYLYSPHLIDTIRDRGLITSAIANYDTDGFPFDLSVALKQSVFILASQHGRKNLVLITDRAQNMYHINKVLSIIQTNQFDVCLHVIGMGENYHKGLADIVNDNYRFKSVSVENIKSELSSIVTQE